MAEKAILVGMHGASGSTLVLSHKQNRADGFGMARKTKPEQMEEVKANAVAQMENMAVKIREEVEAEGYTPIVRHANVTVGLWEKDNRFWEVKWDLDVEMRKMPPLKGLNPLKDTEEECADE